MSFPRSRWEEIKLAEQDTAEGQLIYNKLKEEFIDKYLYKKYDDHSLGNNSVSIDVVDDSLTNNSVSIDVDNVYG